METSFDIGIPSRLRDNKLVDASRVLIIDDSQDMLVLYKTILESEGYQVFTASSGEEALIILSETNPPDLILLDMNMDDMSGVEFIEVLEKYKTDIIDQVPIVFLSGMDQVPKSRAVGFIRKPTGVDDLIEKVNYYIAAGKKNKNISDLKL